MERGRIKKPGQELYKSEPSEYYKAQDLFVGARVSFHGHNFVLVDADEYTFNYMEKNANEVKQALVNFCYLSGLWFNHMFFRIIYMFPHPKFTAQCSLSSRGFRRCQLGEHASLATLYSHSLFLSQNPLSLH